MQEFLRTFDEIAFSSCYKKWILRWDRGIEARERYFEKERLAFVPKYILWSFKELLHYLLSTFCNVENISAKRPRPNRRGLRLVLFGGVFAVNPRRIWPESGRLAASNREIRKRTERTTVYLRV